MLTMCSMDPTSADGLLEFTHNIPLSIPVIGLSPSGRIIQTIDGIRPQRLPELVSAGSIEALLGFIRQQLQPALQIFQLSNRHIEKTNKDIVQKNY